MISALRRKLLRDLVRLQGQVLTIALVVACGVAGYVTMVSTYRSLHASRDVYYERYRFADVFAHCERAPRALEVRLRAIPGVADLETRIVEDVRLEVPGMAEPVVGRLVSIDATERPARSAEPMGARVNALFLRRGRPIDPTHGQEVLVSEPFASAHRLDPGDRFALVVQGRRQQVRIAGIALSPEYVSTMQEGSLAPDDKRFGIVWMDRRALAAAVSMTGAFDDVAIRLRRGASVPDVIDAVDRLLERHGGRGAYGRDRQSSDRMVSQELGQLQTDATVIPAIFLAVAAFLVNVVMSRLVGTQREQIAALKAMGYRNTEVGMHYLELVFLIVLLGSVLGTGLGGWLGHAMTQVYMEYFKFPILAYTLDARSLLGGIGVSLVSAVVGTLGAVRSAVSLPPAEAMRPEPPARYRRALLDLLGVLPLLSPAARMVVRDLERRPVRALMSSLGIALAAAIVIVGRFSIDSIDSIIETQFERAQRDDMTVGFVRPLPLRAVRELAHLPGVLRAEPMRFVAVRLHAGHLQREVGIQATAGDLRRLFDVRGELVDIPADGMLLSSELARRLGARAGDPVDVELLEGSRKTRRLVIAGLVDDIMGLSAYMTFDGVHHLLREQPRASAALLSIDRAGVDTVFDRLTRLPAVAGVTRKELAVQYFRERVAQMMVVWTMILAAFASAIAVGIVYNNARIALSVRARDLASLRVLGFTRAEVAAMLVAEQAIQIALAIPLGLVLGRWMADAVMTTVDAELYRMPVLIAPKTYAFATIVVLVSAVISALLVRRKLDRLDLVGALKARD